jgi:GNAT superfamily N-acetyltransferase
MPRGFDPSLFSLVDRPLRPDEARQISNAIRETPNILGYSARELLAFRSCLVAETKDGTLAGVCVVKRLSRGCSEIAFILILPAYRRKGIGSVLFRRAFTRLAEETQMILCVSREPSILRLMEEAGMRYIPEWRLPLAVHLAKMRHYASVYRFREGFRKTSMYIGKPPFRYAVWEKRACSYGRRTTGY